MIAGTGFDIASAGADKDGSASAIGTRELLTRLLRGGVRSVEPRPK